MTNGLDGRIVAVITTVLGRSVPLDADIFDAGASSLEVLEIVLQLEGILNREVEMGDLLDAPTIGDFITRVCRQDGSVVPGSALAADAETPGRPL